ncbi:unnamed protein product [Ixodes persulcatus]
MADWKEKILHYAKRLERNQSDEKVLETLRKLQHVPMTISLLQETGIGRSVNRFKKNDGTIGETARHIISSWKQVVSDGTADFSEQTLPPAKRSKREAVEDDRSSPKASKPSRPYSIEVETSSRGGSSPSPTRREHNGDRHGRHRPHHEHHEHRHRNHTREEAPQSSKVESSPQKSPEKKVVDKKQMKKLLKKAGHSEGGLDGSIASFEACLGLNDTVPQPKAKKKPAAVASPIKKSVAKPVKEPAKEPARESFREPAHHESKERHRTSHHGASKPTHSRNGDASLTKHSSSKKIQKMPEALRKPDLAPLDRDEVLSTLPEIQPVYKPLPHRPFDEGPMKPTRKNMTNEEAISFLSSRKDRTAVYSGRKNCFLPEVPSLHEACVKVLIENIDSMAYTGGVPYDILKPILEKCTARQLYSLEDYNPYLLEESDELWQAHCIKDFKGSVPEEGETWREVYLKKYDEREEKFKSLTATISASMAKATPVRQTKLAYVDTVAKPPRSVARQQAKHGTGLPVAFPIKPGERAAVRPVPASATSSSSNSSSSSVRPSSTAASLKKPKHAPLMQKTLKFMKQRFKR